MHGEHELNLRIWYRWISTDEDSLYECKIAYALPGSDGFLEVKYSGESEDDFIPDITADITEYIRFPKAWTQEQIRKGPDTPERLRQLEKERDACRYKANNAAWNAKRYEEQRQQVEAEITRLQAEIIP